MANINTLRKNSRNLFDREIRDLIDSDSKKDEKRGRQLMKAGKEIKCFYCLDYEIVYKDRGDAFSNLDGRGNYDIINCLCCRENSNWIECSNSPDKTYPGILKRGDRERAWFESRGQKIMESLADKLENKIGGL